MSILEIGGSAVTVISAEGGSVFTLATNGAGEVTSIGGSGKSLSSMRLDPCLT
jgi:hypothetical protein